MSDNKAFKSSGTLQLATGKKFRGELVAGDTSASFYARSDAEPVVSFSYSELKSMSRVRRGGTSCQATIILKDDKKYIFELTRGLMVYDYMNNHWAERPVEVKTRGDELRRLAELRGERIQRPRHHLIRRRHPNRSIGGDIGIYLMLVIVALLMAFPLVFAISASLKPLDELFRFPPTVFPRHPTTDNYSDLLVTMGQSFVPFSRYLFNTFFITFVGTAGHLLIASMAAFVLAKYRFPGGRLFFGVVTTCLMFTGYVTGIPNYLIMSRLHIIDTYWALILPAFSAPIGLFMMKQFMEGLPTALIEAAHIDGAGEMRIFWSIVMPNVKPAWLTVIIFSVQGLWNNSASTVIYSEAKKTLSYALQQIQAGGIARTGQAAAVTVVVMLVPITIFILFQGQIVETMSSSGLKD